MSTVLKSGILNLLEPSGPVQACNGIALPLLLVLPVDLLNRFYNKRFDDDTEVSVKKRVKVLPAFMKAYVREGGVGQSCTYSQGRQ